MSVRDRQFVRLSGAARAFAAVALVAPLLWSRDKPALLALGAVVLVWAGVQLAQTRHLGSATATAALEALAIGTICGFSLHTSVAVLGALSVPPFAAGLRLGFRGVAIALGTEVAALATICLIQFTSLSAEQTFAAFTWTVTGLGLGLIAGFLHSTLQHSPDALAPYRYAQSLIRELIDLSGGLSSGLDPVPLGSIILDTVRDDLPTAGLVLYVPRSDSLTPLVTKTVTSTTDLTAVDDLALEAWALSRPVLGGRTFAFPLVSQAGTTAVVGGVLSERLDPTQLGLEAHIRELSTRLAPSTVHLDTALLFAAFRDAATADERRRLAREMHDGVAQDIASLGYLVDALAARPASPEQAERIETLRDRITAVVAEVRRSVLTLRTDAGASESLGAAIGSIARNLTEVSGVPIHVALDERATRLRPEVEAELFRIAQEAMTNAVRHARATRIDVHCQVHAPDALITVTDDGHGLQSAREDSHGLEIMRERALLIGAALLIDDGPDGGTVVDVRTSPDACGAPVDSSHPGEIVVT